MSVTERIRYLPLNAPAVVTTTTSTGLAATPYHIGVQSTSHTALGGTSVLFPTKSSVPAPTTPRQVPVQVEASPAAGAKAVPVQVSAVPVSVEVVPKQELSVVVQPRLTGSGSPSRQPQAVGQGPLTPQGARTPPQGMRTPPVVGSMVRVIPGTGLEAMEKSASVPCLVRPAAMPVEGYGERAATAVGMGSLLSVTVNPTKTAQYRVAVRHQAVAGEPVEVGDGLQEQGACAFAAGVAAEAEMVVTSLGDALAGPAMALPTTLVGPEVQERCLPIVAMPVISDPLVAPFSQEACGTNLTLSEDGYLATRHCGCRESAVMGSCPLQRQMRGLYFEVKLRQVLEGWLGGLGIGVTHSPPGQLARLPDKAWRVPESFVVGYSGSAYLNGNERRLAWQPDGLKVGQHVGLLITGDGRQNMLIFVDGEEVLRIDGGDLHALGLRDAPLYPIVDVYNAAQSVALVPRATLLAVVMPGA